MMKYLLALLLLFSQLTAFSQKDRLTLYAFEQKVSPGIAPARDVEEGGKVIQKATGSRIEYYIFIIVPKDVRVSPTALWIKGKLFDVRAKEVSTPVVRPTAKDSAIILVPRMEQQVLQLIPLPALPGKAQRGAILARQNELVLVYQSKGRFHDQVQEHFTILDPVQMQ